MKTTIFMKRIDREDMGHILPVPLYQSGRDAINKIGEGEVRQIEIKNPRNLAFHNLFMAQLRMVVNNTDGKWKSVDHILAAVKKSLGLYDIVRGFDGKDITIDRSIAFESMDEDKFRETVYDPAQPLLSQELGISVIELQDPDHYEEYL